MMKNNNAAPLDEIMKLLQSAQGPGPASQRGSNTPWYNSEVPNQPGVPFNRRQTYAQMQGRGANAPTEVSSLLDGLVNAKPVRNEDRGRYGIDPRDPNSYSVMPDGQLIGTLIGWNDNMPNLNDIAGRPGFRKLPQFNVPGGIQTNNMIPRAKPNQYGMTRVSPGMYQNEKGKTVRSTTGRPRTIKMTETETKKD